MDQGVDAHAIIVDGYERLHRGRHDVPFLMMSPSPPSIIVWSATGYYPDEPPSWLPPHRHLQVAADDLSSILELDGDLDEAASRAWLHCGKPQQPAVPRRSMHRGRSTSRLFSSR